MTQHPQSQPLADRIRPQTLDEFIGQKHLVGEGKPIFQAVKNNQAHSMIFWGPPGVGKTTLARIIAHHTGMDFVQISAVSAGKADLRKIVAGAQDDGRCPEFDHLWVVHKRPDPPEAYYDQAEKEFLAVATDFYRAHPNMGAMLLECTGMQPFARALQREIDIPLFSWGTLLDYAYSVAVHRDYYGHV